MNLNLPEWLSVEAWEGYLEMRKAIKKPLKKRGALMALRRLNELRLEGYDPSMVLDQSTFMCWRGLFPLKGKGDGDGATRKTFDAIRRESSADAIKRTVGAYQQMAGRLLGTPPQRTKPSGSSGIH